VDVEVESVFNDELLSLGELYPPRPKRVGSCVDDEEDILRFYGGGDSVCIDLEI